MFQKWRKFPRLGSWISFSPIGEWLLILTGCMEKTVCGPSGTI
jgi:hypothetical protein